MGTTRRPGPGPGTRARGGVLTSRNRTVFSDYAPSMQDLNRVNDGTDEPDVDEAEKGT